MANLARTRCRVSSVSAARAANVVTGSWPHRPDCRWPYVVDVLEQLWLSGRRSLRIVDIDCGAGTTLLRALNHARRLGFVGIEGRGIDGAPALIGRARAAAERMPDPAIGVVFEVGDVADVLDSESEFPADIVLWHGSRVRDRVEGMAERLARAADIVIGDAGTAASTGART